jgi:hypothetical protein
MHLVLLGDSIFDNASYTRGEPDVVSHLQQILPSPWRATLLAVDGATTGGIGAQMRRVPADASHLVVSVGGNDALGNIDLLSMVVRSSAEALAIFGRRVEAFETAYRDALSQVIAAGLPVTVCTIYNGAIPDPAEASRARMALTLFNDAIVRAALDRQVPVIDLRMVCNEPADYANPIEPSGPGGAKIARAVARAVGALDEVEPSLFVPHRFIIRR